MIFLGIMDYTMQKRNGEIYYVNYDFYAEHLSYVTNILEIS